ncbi:MAG: hypothetical protein ABIJ57_03320, partial [Pseudomonadota bacterium]
MNDKTRREFLKTCFRIGGYAAIAQLGMGAIEDARGWGILPAIVGSGGGGGTWATWDELSQSTLASDNTFVVLEDAPGNGDPETGEGGGLTGADLVLSDTGTVPAAVGSPPYRTFNGVNMYQDPTVVAADLVDNVNKTWTAILKIGDLSVGALTQLFDFNSGTLALRVYADAAGLLQPYLTDNVGFSAPTTTDAIPGAGAVYIVIWADGTDARYGFATTKPTKWSDFEATKRGIFANPTGDM